ncbi:hypothetical protein M3Y95_00664600 [Aphelenchoides besseyi]|nr:hypothetical protein M3Y95_00664600 [Aphelenchoides besseyi]
MNQNSYFFEHQNLFPAEAKKSFYELDKNDRIVENELAAHESQLKTSSNEHQTTADAPEVQVLNKSKLLDFVQTLDENAIIHMSYINARQHLEIDVETKLDTAREASSVVTARESLEETARLVTSDTRIEPELTVEDIQAFCKKRGFKKAFAEYKSLRQAKKKHHVQSVPANSTVGVSTAREFDVDVEQMLPRVVPSMIDVRTAMSQTPRLHSTHQNDLMTAREADTPMEHNFDDIRTALDDTSSKDVATALSPSSDTYYHLEVTAVGSDDTVTAMDDELDNDCATAKSPDELSEHTATSRSFESETTLRTAVENVS